jgi:hypothetical protein
MPDPPEETPPDLDTEKMDDNDFLSEVSQGDLSRAMGILGMARIEVHRESAMNEYYILGADGRKFGQVRMVQAGGWAVEDANGKMFAMLWRQHTEDHQVDNVSSLVHLGFHRWERARKEETKASLYCLAMPDKKVRFFVTYIGHDAVLETPSNRVALKMAPGSRRNEIKIVDPYDEEVAKVSTLEAGMRFTHEIDFEELEDPFFAVILVVAISLELGFRHGGEWESPFHDMSPVI